jgi:hypothetical protein
MRDVMKKKKESQMLRKQMDKTFLDNLDEVYLFMSQRTM